LLHVIVENVTSELLNARVKFAGMGLEILQNALFIVKKSIKSRTALKLHLRVKGLGILGNVGLLSLRSDVPRNSRARASGYIQTIAEIVESFAHGTNSGIALAKVNLLDGLLKTYGTVVGCLTTAFRL
jgi:hypothetical protein